MDPHRSAQVNPGHLPPGFGQRNHNNKFGPTRSVLGELPNVSNQQHHNHLQPVNNHGARKKLEGFTIYQDPPRTQQQQQLVSHPQPSTTNTTSTSGPAAPFSIYCDPPRTTAAASSSRTASAAAASALATAAAPTTSSSSYSLRRIAVGAAAASKATTAGSASSQSGEAVPDWAVGPLSKLSPVIRTEQERRRQKKEADERLDRSIAQFRNPLRTLSQQEDEISFKNVTSLASSSYVPRLHSHSSIPFDCSDYRDENSSPEQALSAAVTSPSSADAMEEDASSSLVVNNLVQNVSMESTATAEDDDEEEEELLDVEEPVVPVLRPEEEAMFAAEEYTAEIFSNMYSQEAKYAPKCNYMTKQPDISFPMRAILVDWLVEVGEEYKLNSETIYLSVNYIDRFLSIMSVQRGKLQLVGTACMFIAAKYEEIYPPDVSEFVYITDDTYSKKQVLRMEQLVLSALNFNLHTPTQLFFVNMLSKAARSDNEATFLAQYLSELTLMDAENYLIYRASDVACAVVALARHTLSLEAWPAQCAELVELSVEDFKEILISVHTTFTNAPGLQQQAIKEKYKNARYMSVAEIEPMPIF